MADPFVVGIDRTTVVAKRRGAKRANQVGIAVSGLVGAALVAVGVVGLTSAVAGDGPYAVGLVGLVGLVLAAGAVAQARVFVRARSWYEATDLPDEVIRMTADGMQLASEGATEPIWLPWPAVAGFRYTRAAGQPVLTLLLTPGVTPSTPGVRGLDQPAVVRANRRRGVYYGLAALDQTADAIDTAMRAFTADRTGVLR